MAGPIPGTAPLRLALVNTSGTGKGNWTDQLDANSLGRVLHALGAISRLNFTLIVNHPFSLQAWQREPVLKMTGRRLMRPRSHTGP